ncbi:MAG: hypothetical protein ACYCXG_06660 [Acidiferrobacter sp.]
MMSVPASLRPLVPQARYVLLRPYTALSVRIVPNLGVRLLFPPRLASRLTLTVTNPLFHVTMLPRDHGVVLTVVRGVRHRYCGNVFAGTGRFAVSLLICTARRARATVSDLVFTEPPPPLPPPPRPRSPRPWRGLVAQLAFGHLPVVMIRRQLRLGSGAVRGMVAIRRFVLTPTAAVLGVRVVGALDRDAILGLALYRGHGPRRALASRFACRPGKRAQVLRCAVIVARPHHAVGRWHLVVITVHGTAQIAW